MGEALIPRIHIYKIQNVPLVLSFGAFFIYADTMLKKTFFIILCSVVFISTAQARQCDEQDLIAIFEHSHEITQTPSTKFNVIIEGRLETPTPGYKYSLKITSADESEMSKGTLKIFHPRPNDPALTVISHVDISEAIEIPKTSKGIIINVEKSHNWGPKRFTLELPEDFFGSTFLCLKPDVTE